MERIIAVRVDETPEGPVAHGFISRGKNRKRVWTIPVGGLSPAQVKVAVDAAEAKRQGPAQPLGE